MNTIAFVTVYKPNTNVAYNVSLLKEQVSQVVIIDNTEERDNSKLFSQISNCVYLWNKKNLGLSTAFNNALKKIDIVKKSDYVLFFDQDSSIPEEFIKKLVLDFEKAKSIKKIGCLGAMYYDSTKKEFGGLSKIGEKLFENCFEVSELITSSMITTYKILETVDFWNEHIFLDYADFELCWRMKAKGFYIALSKNAVLNHSLGYGNLKIRFLFKMLNITYSKPFREYYQTRDVIKLLKMKYVPMRWKKNFIFNITIRIFIFIIKLPNRKERFTYFLKGLFDGLVNKDGSYKQL